jgi:hypothetical protein
MTPSLMAILTTARAVLKGCGDEETGEYYAGAFEVISE